MGTIVWKREWPSMAAMETAYARSFEDPEAKTIHGEEIVVEEWREYLMNVEDYMNQ